MERRFLAIILILSIAYRFWLWDVFFGWEESDYGNIAMVRGVYQSGFRHYDMNHMPGYYGLAALFLIVQDNAVIASKLMSTIGGGVSLLAIVLLLKRMAGLRPAIVLSLVLFFQPEFSLYAASALREPVYTLFLVAVLWSMVLRYWWFAGIFSALAFLVRFEYPLTLIPILVFLLSRSEHKSILKLLLPLGVTIVLWMLYCQFMYDTYAFWSHAASSNIETGLGAEAFGLYDWCVRGLSVAFDLLFFLLPKRLGWPIWLGWLFCIFLIPRESKMRMTCFFSYGLVCVWLLVAFVAQHQPDHNLYWKWMYPLIPFLACCGVWGWNALISRFSIHNHIYRKSIWLVLLIGTWASHYPETKSQIDRSWRLYRPQIELAKKVEEVFPQQKRILFDNIPACWLNRQTHNFQMISWFDVPVSPNDPQSFALWLHQEDIWGVLWFREDWTQAPKIAPFLAKGGIWKQGNILLEETSREDEYGWIYYQRLAIKEE